MSQRDDKSNGAIVDPLATMRRVRDIWTDSWSRLAIQFVNNDAYAQMTGGMLDTYLTLTAPYRQLLNTTMTRTLADLNMPSRAEVSSIAERLANIETRLDDMDARVDELKRAVKQPAAEAGANGTPAVTEDR